MPTTITLYQIGVWLCVGLFVGLGWAVAQWAVAKSLK